MNRLLNGIHVAVLPLNTGYARTSGFTVVFIDVVVVKERRVSAVGLVLIGKGDVTSVGSIVSTVRGLRRLVSVGENVGGFGRVLGVLIEAASVDISGQGRGHAQDRRRITHDHFTVRFIDTRRCVSGRRRITTVF